MKLLSIGNSFSANPLTYLSSIFESAGSSLILGRVSIGGCPLDLHWHNAENDIARYGLEYEGPYTLREMLLAEEWDVVTLQQVSHLSWKIGTYQPYAQNLADYVKAYAPNAKLVLQQTWAYRTDNERLLKDIQISQKQMMQLIRENYNTLSESLGGLPILPVGEAFAIHQKLTGDGVGLLTRNDDAPSHANALGRYMGGLVWYCGLTGGTVEDVSFLPPRVDPALLPMAKEAVRRAMAGEIG